MNFRTFFTLLFIISISLCLGSTFFPDILKSILNTINITENIKFIGLMSLIIALFAYIGMVVSFYFARKREKARRQKLKDNRINIDEIHAELESLR